MHLTERTNTPTTGPETDARTSGVTAIAVTPEMIQVGLEVLMESGAIRCLTSADALLVEQIFRSMAQAQACAGKALSPLG